ncbi:MAG: hypothetical protein DMF88_19385 [Acidobacteria bacterium]|nr:MAG: hypothetical protein DMF88_19385 [Acidobacteriota bacterium]
MLSRRLIAKAVTPIDADPGKSRSAVIIGALADETQRRSHPHHAHRKLDSAAQAAGVRQSAPGRSGHRSERVRGDARGLGARGCRAPGRGGHRHSQRRRVRQVHELVAVRPQAAQRLRAAGGEGRQPVCARGGSAPLRGFLRGARRTRRRQGLVERDEKGCGVRRTDHVQRPLRAAARHRQPQGRDQRRRCRRGLPAGRRTLERHPRPQERVLQDRRGFALAEALRTEYRAIVNAGFLLQVDDARAAVTYDRMVPPASFEDYFKWPERHVETLNHALEAIPQDRIRYHVCRGSWPGPHTTDVPLRKIVDLILKVNAGAYLLEAANPRHEHEWKVWQEVKLPPGKILVPGVVSHGTNVVGHPELIAERLTRFASCVGRENLIAGTDCGFAQEEINRRVHPSIMWAKLEAMAEGARIASRALSSAPDRHFFCWPVALSMSAGSPMAFM